MTIPYHREPAFTLAQTAILRLHLRVLCIELGTQRAAAKELNVSDRLVSEILSGGAIARRVAHRLAGYRKTTVDRLLAAPPERRAS